MKTENDDVLQGRRQWPLCGLLALRPQLQGWPRRPFGGEQVPPGFSGSSPAPGVLWQRGCKFPLQTPVCSEGLVYPPQAGARTSSKMPPCCRHGPISDPTQLPKDCPSVCLSAHPVSRCRGGSHCSPAPRAQSRLRAARSNGWGTGHAGAQDMLGQLSRARHRSSAPEARGSFCFFPSNPGKPQADLAREEAWRRKEMFTCHRVSDEAQLEVNTFLPYPTLGRPASTSRASTHRQAGSTGCECHHSTDKQAHLGTCGPSDLRHCLPESQPGCQAR